LKGVEVHPKRAKHNEDRSWRGFHHHASLCIAAYAFLTADKCPPKADRRGLASERT